MLFRSDLQAAAEAICPDVTTAIDWLERRFGPGRMTGSGSAVFARTGMGAPPLATCSDGTDPFSDLPVGWVQPEKQINPKIKKTITLFDFI